MSDTFPWSTLGIAETSDQKAIRKAYADAIKAMDPDRDVDGFATLRRARDLALSTARIMRKGDASQDARDTGPAPAAYEAPGASRWGHAAPDLAGEWIYDDALTTRPANGDSQLSFTGLTTPAAADSARGEALSLTLPWGGNGLSAPVLDGYGEVEAALGLTPGQAPVERLEDLLTRPDGSFREDPLDEASQVVARRAMHAILDEARDADVTRHDRIEGRLAALLANGWPRSAPLLEEAAQGFNWANEWDRFDARPVIAFIGQRLRGLRFVSRVEDSGHRYHRAWTELRRPGTAPFWRRLQISSSDITGLLSGIRHHFPEVEEYLDSARVASWEKKRRWPRGLLLVGWLLLLGLWLWRIDFGQEPEFLAPDGTYIPLAEDAPGPADIDKAADAAIAQAFGEGHDLDWLWDRQNDLARDLIANLQVIMRAPNAQPEASQALVDIVRQRLFFTARGLEGSELEEAARLRLDLLQAASTASPAACVDFLRSARIESAVTIPADLRRREQALAARLAEQGRLAPLRSSSPRTIRIPASLIGSVIAATGLDQSQVRTALRGEAEVAGKPEPVDPPSDSERCRVAIALLDAALHWQDDTPASRQARTEILRTL